MAFTANYAGTCKACGDGIAAGDTIKRATGRGYAHTDCDTAAPGPEKGYGGRCIDAPCCGCCGGWQQAETAYLVY